MKEKVYMVDFSLQPFEDMVNLFFASQLVWIDHHESAIKEERTYRSQLPRSGIPGIRKIGLAGCELTWQYLFPDSPLPEAVRLLGRYDVWDLKDPAVLPFQFGMRTLVTWPKESLILWNILLDDRPKKSASMIKALIQDGEAIMRYAKEDSRKYCSSASFETTLDGLKCIAVNKLLTNSQLFDSVWDPDKYHAMIAFGFRNGGWTVSLYSTRRDVNCGEVCKARGGGGHKGAAGFQCKKLPFKLK
jgi:oligoribonuclease NrnB/cAMP/cGMP phosphodiesterase (DHH superfamily)